MGLEFIKQYVEYLPQFATILAVVDVIILAVTIPWILAIKKESNAAVAWCLVVLLLPVFGFLLFVIFGYSQVHRPIRRKRKHRVRYPERLRHAAHAEPHVVPAHETYEQLGLVAVKLGAYPVTSGNLVTQYHDTNAAYEELLQAIASARHHVHVEFFIIRGDETGTRFLDELAKKARSGVEVRVLYDAMGCYRTKRRTWNRVRKAGGKCVAFFPIDILRRRLQLNPRMHRKIVVIDGKLGFTGGMNIGSEYLGHDPYHGYWRDAFVKVVGPGAEGLQHVFAEDWDFASDESIEGEAYFPLLPACGPHVVQIIASGPDQDINSIRELIFTSITLARDRVWIASPYLVPDTGILDALRSAARAGVDVRLMFIKKPDHWLPYYAAYYYLPDLLAAGVKVYQYDQGMMHAKYCVIDDAWGWLGSSNLDNRSLRLSFEANCIFHSAELVRELAKAFQCDLERSQVMHLKDFANRPFLRRVVENASRLFSPAL